MRISYGWVVVAAGALMTCVAFGAVFSLAVFLQPMSDATGWSRAGISGAMTLVFLAMGAGGFAWGTLSDRMALGPLAGGWIFDASGAYTWLYVGSFAVGMGAVAIALAFPPFRTSKEFAHG